MRELNPQILKAFNLRSKNSKRMFGAYYCETNKGLKIVKETHLEQGKVLFVHSAKEHLIKNGFENIDRYCISKEGLPYFEYNKNTYVIKDWIEGKECNFQNETEIQRATKVLAEMHNASRGMKPIQDSIISMYYGELPMKTVKNYKELIRIYKNTRNRGKWTNFDVSFLKSYKKYSEDMVEALEVLEKCNYEKLVNDGKVDNIFCHNKYTNHNIQLDERGIMITNFDNCGYQLPVFDFQMFVEKIMSKNDWDIKIGLGLIDEYCKTKPLSKDEYQLLYFLLLFPKKYWKLCNHYYNTRRCWSPKISETKLDGIIEQSGNKKDFLNTYKKQYLT